MKTKSPDLKHLVLMGGGHAQVSVLKSLAMKPVEGLRITLISRDVMTPYSGMLPGYLEGAYSAQDISIDLSHLARLAGARFIHGTVSAIDPDDKTITINGRPEMAYDILSINTGSAPNLDAIKGADQHAIPVKPISTLLDRLSPLLSSQDNGIKIAIIGGGAAGVEVALSLHHRMNITDKREIEFCLIHRGKRIMPEFPKKAAKHLMRDMAAKNITVYCGHGASEIKYKKVVLENGNIIDADVILVVTAGLSPEFIKTSKLALDDRGFIAVGDDLASVSHPDVFASGDVASVVSSPRPKAGVFAVRAGPILTQNLRHAVFKTARVNWKPQGNYLALVGTGGGKAMPIRGPFVLPPSSWAWRLKEWIDRRFIEKFSNLPVMKPQALSALGQMMAEEDQRDDPALMAMRCLGCGAKTGWSDLDQAIAHAQDFIQSQGYDLSAPIKTTQDSANFTLPNGQIVQSVDAISALVDDAFLLGRIAALHAMSDLFASNAKPHSALAILTLPSALAALQKDDITQLLAGAMIALHDHGTLLTGGHTSQAQDMQVGFAVTGIADDGDDYIPQDGDHVILTKPLGIGMVMAGHMKSHPLASGEMRDQAIEVMATSNGDTADILRGFGRFPMTDVTGFGLARHGLSLLSACGDGTASFEFKHDALPLIDGVIDLARDGMESSITKQNALAAPINSGQLDFSQNFPTSILHDPQTGGGLLVVVPKEKSAAIIKKLSQVSLHSSLIGQIKFDQRAEIRLV